MAVLLSFYLDAGLTIAVTQENLGVYSDGSNNPLQGQLYLGHANSGLVWKAKSNPGVDQIQVMPVYKLQDWQANTVYALDNEVKPNPMNSYKYRVKQITGAGQSAAAPPSWPTTFGDTVVDGDITWENVGRHHTPNEVKLATSQAGLAAAVAGAAIDLGVQIDSEAVNGREVWYEVDDPNIEANLADLDLTIATNEVQQQSA